MQLGVSLLTYPIAGVRLSILFQIGFFKAFLQIRDRVHQNSPSMHFRRANTDSGGPIRIQESQNGFNGANTEPSLGFRKATQNRLCILGGQIWKPIRNRI